MAVTVVLCDRTNGKSSKKHVNNVDINSKVKDFRCLTARELDIPVHDIELVYCGQCMQDGESLESYKVGSGTIIHVLKRHPDQQDITPEVMDAASIQQVVTALQAALLNPAHRNPVERMMARPETMENLIASTPGLDKDPIALAMLQDPELLAILADPDHIHKVIERHPCLGQAAMMVATAINEENASSGSGSTSTSGRATYSLDQMSDDDEMGGVANQPSQPITAGQLAAALAAAGSGAPRGGDQQSSSSGSSREPAGQISADFFQQAMMQASGATTAATPSPVTESALQQLRDMGISDEGRARRALALTSGDIQAALELLFGDNDL